MYLDGANTTQREAMNLPIMAFNPDGEPSLEFRDEVAGLRQAAMGDLYIQIAVEIQIHRDLRFQRVALYLRCSSSHFLFNQIRESYLICIVAEI